MSRTSNVCSDTYRTMSMETCCRIQVARSRYMLTVSRRHNYYSFMSRSTCIQQQTGDKLAKIYSCRYKTHVDKWIQVDTTCIGQHVSWCKRGFRSPSTCYCTSRPLHDVISRWVVTHSIRRWMEPWIIRRCTHVVQMLYTLMY